MEFEMVGGMDQTNLVISFVLILILMIVSRVRHILNEAGTWAAAALGLGLAMIGHASWNLVWTLFDLFVSNSSISQMMVNILDYTLMAMMVGGILIIGTGLLHSVREAPDGSEVDEYQAQLAQLTQQRL